MDTSRSTVGLLLALSLAACGEDHEGGLRVDGSVEGPDSGHLVLDGSAQLDAGDPLDAGRPGDGGAPSCDPIARPSPSWFVSPEGAPSAAGTSDDPLDLATALSASGPVGPGDRVELAAGTYVGRFVSDVSGSAEAPVVVAAAPGARVTLDSRSAGSGSGMTFEGEWVEIHGIELTNSGVDRGAYPGGVEMHAQHSKLVNCVVHDTALGVSFWSSAVDSELYGNIIYNNGYEGASRGHGHAIYTQNANGTKRIANNIIFFGYGFGIHAYTEGGSIQGFDFIDNVWFRAGASRPGSSVEGTSDGCLIGGLQPVARTRLEGNHSFGPSVDARSLRLGWGSSVTNEHVTLLRNYLVGGVAAQGMWEGGTLEDNVFHSALSGIDPEEFPDNEWHTSLPTGKRVVVHANDYDPTRLDLIIYNWDEAEAVTFDMSDVLAEGARYEVFSVYDLWGEPVASGRFDGGSIRVPMGARDPVQPNGDPAGITGADDPGRTFGVFVLRSSCAVARPSTASRTGT